LSTLLWHGLPTMPTLRPAWPEDGRFIDAVAVEIAGNGLVAGLAELDHAVGRIDLSIAVAIDDPFAVAEDGDLFDAVAVEIADDGQVALLTKLGGLVAVGPAAIAVGIKMPAAIAENADGADAVAVPVAGDRNVVALAELEDMINEVGPLLTLRGEAQQTFAVGRLLGRWRHVLGPCFEGSLVVLVGQAGVVLDVNRVARPARTKDADVVLAV